MQTLWLGAPLATAALLALAVPATWAAGFGNPETGAVLGQPLDFAVPLRLDAGQPIEPRCVAAKVTVGDRLLPAGAVETAIEMTGAASARIRVLTRTAIDEPVVGVVLDVGCQARLSRRFVVLADPPGLGETATASAGPAPITPIFVTLPAAERVMAAERAAPATLPASVAAATAAAATGAVPTSPAAGSTARPGNGPDRPDARPSRTGTLGTRPRRTAPRGTVVAAATPRLKLDAAVPEAEVTTAEMLAVEQALQAVAEAASAVRAANQAASAAEERAEGLARTAEQWRVDALAQREAAAAARESLRRSESLSNWVWPLLLGVLALAALAGWLAWQLAALRRVQRQGWTTARDRAAAAATGFADAALSVPPTTTTPLPLVKPAAAPPPSRPRPGSNPAWPPPAAAELALPPAPDTVAVAEFAPSPPAQAHFDEEADAEALPPVHRSPAQPQPLTTPATVAAHKGDPGLRDLSIEELIDLEQQAEFFVVLGQDAAAIDLLVEHTRSTGGNSPLPYLKLLEIYQRQGDREAFERTRGRFNQRFNAYAADWGTSLQQGRGLEDYAGVLPRLVQVWPRPIDAMAELEALLFRKSRGELFDLPAYREVLFLYALARDLLDREAADTGNVDLLLPLADGGEFGVTAPHPYFGLDHDSVFDRLAVDDRPTAPVDLDLSLGDGPARIFDPLAASRPPAKPLR